MTCWQIPDCLGGLQHNSSSLLTHQTRYRGAVQTVGFPPACLTKYHTTLSPFPCSVPSEPTWSVPALRRRPTWGLDCSEVVRRYLWCSCWQWKRTEEGELARHSRRMHRSFVPTRNLELHFLKILGKVFA